MDPSLTKDLSTHLTQSLSSIKIKQPSKNVRKDTETDGCGAGQGIRVGTLTRKEERRNMLWKKKGDKLRIYV